MMIGDILYVNEINYESFTSRAETIQLRESSRSFAIHRFHNRKRCVHAFFCSYVQSESHVHIFEKLT